MSAPWKRHWPFRLVSPVLAAALLAGMAGGTRNTLRAAGRDLYVNPTIGADSATGLAAKVSAAGGPVKTIAQGVRLARPGDTVHLARAVYHESIDLTGRSGEPGKPLVIDGHGAVLDGSRPIKPEEWKEVAPGLYRNTTLFPELLRKQPDWVWRWFMIFDGKVNRMGRCMKGNNAPYKKPADLKPGEWTYQQSDGDAFYIKVEPSRKLADCRVETPWEFNGVSVHGANHDLVIRNLTATRVINDGYNISPTTKPLKIYDILFENIAAIECGDDGLSAHGDSTVRVEGFHATGNGTGICTTGNSVNNRLHLSRNVGHEVYFYESLEPGETTHVIRNSFIDCGADNAFVVFGGRQPGAHCTVQLENVTLTADPRSPTKARTVRIGDKARLEAKALTARGLSFDVQGLGLSLHDSVITGGAPCAIAVGSGSAWAADRNLYDIGSFQIGAAAYKQSAFDAYRRATGGDAGSKWQKLDQPPNSKFRFSLQGKPVGADVSVIPGIR